MITLNNFKRAIKRILLFFGSLFPACNQTAPAAPMEIIKDIVAPQIDLGNTDRFVKLEITLKGAKNPDFAFTDLAFNKNKGFLFMKDDGIRTDYSIVYKILNGGEVDGKRYPGFTFDDGTGKQIGYKYSFAINANEGHSTSPNATTWAQMMEMIEKGHSIMNHTLLHGGTDKLKALKDGEKNMWIHTRYRMTEIVIPGNEEGLVETGLHLGYEMISSEFGEPVPDGNNDPGNVNISWNAHIATKTQNFHKVLVSRANLGDKWDTNELSKAKAFIDYIFQETDLSKKPIGAAFSHGPFSNEKQSAENFNDFMNYIKHHPANQGSAWITSSKELMDYFKTKETVVVSSRNFDVRLQKYDLVFDMANVDPNVIYRNLSLKLTGGEIISIKITGAKEVTFNSKTGLINVYKTDRSKVKDPFDDSLPPQIVGLTANKNILSITYDKPVSQSLIQAYSVSDNNIVKMQGSGKNWTLILQTPLTSSQLFSYRMQRGDARFDGNPDFKVCSYIGMPIKLL